MTDSGAGEPLRMCAKRLAEYLDHRVGCDATWRNGVRRKTADRGQCGCGLADLLAQPIPVASAGVRGLDVAWAEAEAALPEGWGISWLGHSGHGSGGRDWTAHAQGPTRSKSVYSDMNKRTPAEALLSLADKLRQR